MEFLIKRDYHKEGTNGTLFLNHQFFGFSIELPWKENQVNISCIPEGIYELERRVSNKFGQHLIIPNVPGRRLILIHPANYALKELEGCIAPVTYLSGIGKGIYSRDLHGKILAKAYQAFDQNQSVTLKITS
ncbi:DUF5675 family protein [Flavobacteriaceae bacterium]|nr:DUF5675 family protein [Flavobacteriaceae bacterium]